MRGSSFSMEGAASFWMNGNASRMYATMSVARNSSSCLITFMVSSRFSPIVSSNPLNLISDFSGAHSVRSWDNSNPASQNESEMNRGIHILPYGKRIIMITSSDHRTIVNVFAVTSNKTPCGFTPEPTPHASHRDVCASPQLYMPQLRRADPMDRPHHHDHPHVSGSSTRFRIIHTFPDHPHVSGSSARFRIRRTITIIRTFPFGRKDRMSPLTMIRINYKRRAREVAVCAAVLRMCYDIFEGATEFRKVLRCSSKVLRCCS